MIYHKNTKRLNLKASHRPGKYSRKYTWCKQCTSRTCSCRRLFWVEPSARHRTWEWECRPPCQHLRKYDVIIMQLHQYIIRCRYRQFQVWKLYLLLSNSHPLPSITMITTQSIVASVSVNYVKCSILIKRYRRYRSDIMIIRYDLTLSLYLSKEQML